jgi:hypothetical protein
MYPYAPFLGPLGISVDVHPVTVTKVAVVTQTANAFSFGGFAVASNVSSISQ